MRIENEGVYRFYDPQDKLVYVANADAGVATLLDPGDRRLLVECMGNDLLMIIDIDIDIDARRIVRSVTIGGGPDSIVCDGGLRRLYTTGKSGRLVVIQQRACWTHL